MKIKLYTYPTIIALLSFLLISCEDFVEVPSPNDKLIRDDVFRSEETAISALKGIYNQLFVAAFSNGSRSSVTVLAGLSADNIQSLRTSNVEWMQFQENELTPDNQSNFELWQGAYQIIYLTNSFLEGITSAEDLDADLKLRLEGEARFVRAFTYFYLVNLYGDVPLVLSSNYRDNELAARTPSDEVYNQIIADLETSREVLDNEYSTGEKTQVNYYTATSLLSRVYLYLENWSLAENLSTEVIQANSSYEILNDLNQVFLANSGEAVWQISPLGDGEITTHTNDANFFIIDPALWFFASVKISEDLYSSFDTEDRRLMEWTGYSEPVDANFFHKYKVRYSSEFPIVEYSMVLRLAEQYLIRAETRFKQGNITAGLEDLNVLRERAGIGALSLDNINTEEEELIAIILEERRRELFAEWGHRWLDLKRTEMAKKVLGDKKPSWEQTDLLFPLPQEERLKNPNLSQNPGY